MRAQTPPGPSPPRLGCRTRVSEPFRHYATADDIAPCWIVADEDLGRKFVIDSPPFIRTRNGDEAGDGGGSAAWMDGTHCTNRAQVLLQCSPQKVDIQTTSPRASARTCQTDATTNSASCHTPAATSNPKHGAQHTKAGQCSPSFRMVRRNSCCASPAARALRNPENNRGNVEKTRRSTTEKVPIFHD